MSGLGEAKADPMNKASPLTCQFLETEIQTYPHDTTMVIGGIMIGYWLGLIAREESVNTTFIQMASTMDNHTFSAMVDTVCNKHPDWTILQAEDEVFNTLSKSNL
jgi:hypothetical protein